MRRVGFSPTLAVTYTKIFVRARSIGPHGPTSAHARHTPTRSCAQHMLLGLGTWLSPGHLQSTHSRPVRYYALFRGWLLLSLPSGCFRMDAPLRLALSQALGALTQVSVVPVPLPQLTQGSLLPPSTAMVDSEFDKEAEPFDSVPPDQCSTPPPASSEVILRDSSRWTRYRQVRLDFHPYSQVTRAEYTSNGFGPPPAWKPASPCPRVDHIGFGSHGRD